MPILNVDGQTSSRFLRSRMLEEAGYHVREACSAEEALAFCKTATPELVLLEVALPDEDGFAVCAELKAMHPEVPVVMITSVYHSAEARRDGFRAGADEYLIDPVEPERLVAAVARHLNPPPGAAHAELPKVITDVSGRIVMTNAAAARLLNLSRRGLRTRSLLAFFAPGRDRVATQMSEALSGRVVQGVATIRPRDLKPFAVRLDISAVSWEQGGSLEWVLEPAHGTRRARAGVDHTGTGSADARPDGQRYATSTSPREVQSWTALADGGGTMSSSAGAPNARSNKHDRRQPQDDHRPGQSDAPTEQDAA